MISFPCEWFLLKTYLFISVKLIKNKMYNFEFIIFFILTGSYEIMTQTQIIQTGELESFPSDMFI